MGARKRHDRHPAPRGQSPETDCGVRGTGLGRLAVKDTVTVCSDCLRASCWQYKFLCEGYQRAGTREMTVAELSALDLEHPSYWADEK